MILTLHRDLIKSTCTLGVLTLGSGSDSLHLGYTCEDIDRHLETNPEEKIKGMSAIPRGKYQVVLSYSNRFKKIMPELLLVPGFSGVRVHGGNTAEDTEGCILVGEQRTSDGVRICKKILETIQVYMQEAINNKEQIWMEIN